MENLLNKKFRQLPEINSPVGLSKKIMRRIILLKLRLPIILGSTLTVTLGLLCQRIYSLLIETGASEVVRAIIADFELSWSYLSDSLDGLTETMPMHEVQLLTVNLVLVLAVAIYIYRIYRIQIKNLSTNH